MDDILTRECLKAFDWYAPAERLIFWNKFGYPDWVHTRYGGEFWDAFLYWWYDEEAATKLKSAMSNDQNLPIDPIEIKFWPAYKVNNL